MPLDATVGGANANSFATVAEFLAYWERKLIPSGQATPASFIDDVEEEDYRTIENALMMATGELDREGWLGDVVTDTQALQWPRVGVYNRSGFVVDSATIPNQVKNATCELAYALLLDPAATQDDGFSSVSSVSLGQGEISLSLRPGIGGGGIPSNVIKLISDFLSGRGARVLRA